MNVETGQSFRAMNTDVECVVCGPEERREEAEMSVTRVVELFKRAEKTLSRFDTGSELSKLNAHSGHLFKTSRFLFEVVDAAREAAGQTGGLFDPTVLHALQAAGYDRSFEEIKGSDNLNCLTQSEHLCSWRDIWLDRRNLTIKVAGGCGLDLGGIGKGWTADRAGRGLGGFTGFAIDAGGDIVAGGTRSDGSPWPIGVADPLEPEKDITVIELNDGAVCTSTTAKRRWQADGQWRHHLIDPRTGLPAESDVLSVTITAPTAARAETVAKVALILGSEEGAAFINRQQDVQGLMVTEDSRYIYSSGFRRTPYVA